jgi:hypothetical protein
VLIVDDEETIRLALTRFYQRRGWVVTQAADGLGTVERLIGSSEPFDLVISDVKLPGVSGIEPGHELSCTDEALRLAHPRFGLGRHGLAPDAGDAEDHELSAGRLPPHAFRLPRRRAPHAGYI